MTDPQCLDEMATAFVTKYCSRLQCVRRHIDQLATKQKPVMAEIVVENAKLCDKNVWREVNEIQAVIKMYHHRLTVLKREMNSLQERSKSLRERATRLRQTKQKYDSTARS